MPIKRKDSGTKSKPNDSVLDKHGNVNIVVTKFTYKHGTNSINRVIANALREQDIAAARARGIVGNVNVRENIRVEFAREGEIDNDTSDVYEDDDKAKEESNKRKIHDDEASNDDINQPGPSKRHKDRDANDKKHDESKKYNKDDENDNEQDSDDNDDDDNNDDPKDRRRVCQIEVDAFLPDRPLYLMSNPNPEPGEYPWRIEARGAKFTAKKGERSAQNGESSQNVEKSSDKDKNVPKNGENTVQIVENSSENQPCTSKNGENSSQIEPSTSNNNARTSENTLPGMRFMRYAGSCTVDLYNEQPVVIECSMVPQEGQERDGGQELQLRQVHHERQEQGETGKQEEHPAQQERPEEQEHLAHQERPEQQENQERQVQQVAREARQHILYVNLGRPQQASVFRLVQHTERSDPQVPLLHRQPHIQPFALISDAAIRRFGRADGEDIVVHIGPNGPFAGNIQEIGGRPNRSSLRILSATGYRLITDRSLIHLATAAPNLQRIDFGNTSVTEQGVENFRLIRPDCEVVYSKFEDNDNERGA